jgi:hypothetical protein
MRQSDPLGIPRFLRSPVPNLPRPRVLDTVAPALRLQMGHVEWLSLRLDLNDLRWAARYRCAAAWDGDFGNMVKWELEAHDLEQYLMAQLVAGSVDEATARAWLRA